MHGLGGGRKHFYIAKSHEIYLKSLVNIRFILCIICVIPLSLRFRFQERQTYVIDNHHYFMLHTLFDITKDYDITDLILG